MDDPLKKTFHREQRRRVPRFTEFNLYGLRIGRECLISNFLILKEEDF